MQMDKKSLFTTNDNEDKMRYNYKKTDHNQTQGHVYLSRKNRATPITFFEDDFRILLKCMRGWKQFIQDNKDKKNDKAKHMKGIMKAIVYNEKKLLQKYLIRLRKFAEF